MNFLEEVVERAHHALTDEVFDYLLLRGASVEQVKQTRVGYFHKPPVIEGDTPEIKRFRFWAESHDLRDRIIFPLTNPSGQVIGLNTRGYPKKKFDRFIVKSATAEAILFGFTEEVKQKAWETGWLSICEGTFDWFPLNRAAPQSVCVLSANVSNAQVKFLWRFVRTVVTVLDNDSGGDEGRLKLDRRLGRMQEAPQIFRLDYKGKDPGESWDSAVGSWAAKTEAFNKQVRSEIALMGLD